MTNKQRAEYESWDKTMLITEINRLMRENEKAYQQGRTDKYQEIVSEYILLTKKKVEDIMIDGKLNNDSTNKQI